MIRYYYLKIFFRSTKFKNQCTEIEKKITSWNEKKILNDCTFSYTSSVFNARYLLRGAILLRHASKGKTSQDNSNDSKKTRCKIETTKSFNNILDILLNRSYAILVQNKI